MKLKDDDILQEGDVIHFGNKNIHVVINPGDFLIGKKISTVIRYVGGAKKITRKGVLRWRRLKSNEIIKDGDILVFSDYETRAAGRFHDGAACGMSVIEFLASEHAYRELCGVVTWRIDRVERLEDKKNRISRKEYKARIKQALELIESATKLSGPDPFRYSMSVSDAHAVYAILGGENDE